MNALLGCNTAFAGVRGGPQPPVHCSAELGTNELVVCPAFVQDGEGEVDPNRPVIKPLHQQSLFGV